jgi:hypothetical protein
VTGPTARVMVMTHADVVDPAGRRLRGDLFVDALVPADPDRSLPTVGSYAPYREVLRSDYLADLEGGLLRRRWIDHVRQAERFALPGGVAAPDSRIFDYEMTHDEREIPPFVVGDADAPWSTDHGLKVLVLGDEPPRISGRRTTKGYDLSAVLATAAATRASARDRLVQRPDGMYVSTPAPCIRLHQTGYGGCQVTSETVDPPVVDELMFSIGRVDEANAFGRVLLHSEYGTAVRNVVNIEPTLLPAGPSDLERIAAARAPAVAAVRWLDPFLLPSDLVHAWHDATVARSIVAEEGLSGAVRVLEGVVRLIEHQRQVAPDYSGGFDLERLRLRTVFEIGLLPRPAIEGPRA